MATDWRRYCGKKKKKKKELELYVERKRERHWDEQKNIVVVRLAKRRKSLKKGKKWEKKMVWCLQMEKEHLIFKNLFGVTQEFYRPKSTVFSESCCS